MCVCTLSYKVIREHETRLNGYILTGIARFSGAAVFIFVDLFAFVIANLIQTYIAFQGYYKNKKAGEWIKSKETNGASLQISWEY